MKIHWAVVANSNSARIYAVEKTNAETEKTLTLIKELTHPDSKKKNQDLVSDRPGHYSAPGHARGSYSEVDTKSVEIDKFANEIAHLLEHERTQESYQSLTVLAEPRFYGVLEAHLAKGVKQRITQVIQKDYAPMNIHELQSILQKRTH